MARDEAKIKFTADASDLNEAIKESDSKLKLMRSELKQNASQMKLNGESEELLTSRLEILNSEMEEAKSKTELVSQKLKIAESIFGSNSNEVRNLQVQLNACKNVENGIAADINKANNALNKQADEARSSASAMSMLENEIDRQKNVVDSLANEYKNAVIQYGKTSDQAKILENALAGESRALQKSVQKMDEAERAARELRDGLEDVAEEADDTSDSITDIAAGNILADAFGEIVGSLAGLEQETRQYRNEQSKLSAISETTGQSLASLKDKYSDIYAITADETLSSTAVANMSAMGLSTQQTNDLVHAATGIWAQYGDSIPLDGLMESVNETTKVGQVTGNLADALNWAGINEDDFNDKLSKCSDEQERQQLVVDTLEGKYGKLADSYIENNAAAIGANNAANKMMDAQSKLAEKVAPLQSALTSLAADGIGFLADHLEVIGPLATGVAVALGGLFLVMNGSSIIAGVTGAFTALNLVMAANPAALVVIGIAGLITAFAGLWKYCDGFRNFFAGTWNSMKSSASSAISGIKNTVSTGFNHAKNSVITTMKNAGTSAANSWNSMKNGISTACSSIKSKAGNTFDSVKNKIGSSIDTARSKVDSGIDKIKSSFSRLVLKIPKPSLPSLPHFSLKTSSKTILGKTVTYPTGFDVKWYAKAMDTAMILRNPTIFGAGGNSLLGGGEAGNEVVAGEELLLNMIRNAVQEYSGIDYDKLAKIVAKSCANMPVVLKIDKREIGRIVKI